MKFHVDIWRLSVCGRIAHKMTQLQLAHDYRTPENKKNTP